MSEPCQIGSATPCFYSPGGPEKLRRDREGGSLTSVRHVRPLTPPIDSGVGFTLRPLKNTPEELPTLELLPSCEAGGS
jgi:hypothetical protein